MMKAVLKLEYHDDKIKKKAMQKASGISGIESIALDSTDKKLTVTGDIDPVIVVEKLRKLCSAYIVSFGPAKEPEKKKEEPKKEEPKKDAPKEDPAQLLKAYQAYYQEQLNYYYHQQYMPYYNRSVEEDPNGCIIC